MLLCTIITAYIQILWLSSIKVPKMLNISISIFVVEILVFSVNSSAYIPEIIS